VVYLGGVSETVGAPTPGPGTQHARNIDAQAVEQGIESGRLSGHEARYYAPAKPAPETPKAESNSREE
jgi:hypothetical protein